VPQDLDFSGALACSRDTNTPLPNAMGAAMETVHHIFGTKGASGYGSYSTSSDVVGGVLGGGGVNRLEGKTVLVTGCNCGIGKETVLALCRLEPKVVVMACRDTDKARAAAADVVAAVPGARVKVMPLDLSMMASVRQFAAAFLQSGAPLPSTPSHPPAAL